MDAKEHVCSARKLQVMLAEAQRILRRDETEKNAKLRERLARFSLPMTGGTTAPWWRDGLRAFRCSRTCCRPRDRFR